MSGEVLPRIEELIGRVTDAILGVDADGRIAFASARVAQLFGKPIEELLGRDVWETYPPVPDSSFREQCERAMLRQTAVGMREHFATPDAWFDVRVYPSASGFTALFIDADTAVNAEAALRWSEERFRATFDRAPVGVAHVASDGTFLLVNKRYGDIVGFSPEELASKTYQEITHPDDLAEDERQARAVLAGEIDSYAMEKRYITKSGDAVWVNLTVSLVRDGSGEPSYYVAVVEDIGDRKHVEEQLHEALEERTQLAEVLDDERKVLSAIMENTDAHLAFLDPQFRFILVNETYARGSGHSVEELIGRDHFELFPNEENEEIFSRVRETREPVVFKAKPFEFVDQPWRGVTYWDWRLTPVTYATGELQGLVLSLVDVTESVRARRYSEALNHLNNVIHSTLEFDRLVSQVVGELAVALGVDIAGVALMEGGSMWRIVDAYGLPARGLRLHESQFPSEPVAAQAGRPYLAGEAIGQRFDFGFLAEIGVRSLLVAPLTLGREQLGAIAFGHRSGPGTFDDEQIDFAAKVAASLVLALKNSRLYEAARRSARIAESLGNINEALLSTLTFEDILERVVEESAMAVDADKVIVAETTDGHIVIRHSRGFAVDLSGRRLSLEDFPAIRRAVETGVPQLIEHAATDPDINIEFALRNGDGSFMALPLIAGGETIGVLSYVYDAPRVFDEHDLEFARRLSVALSLALDSARHFEAERTIADRLQEALLAIPDHIEGVEFAHAYHSATEAARVGGDFYDIFELNQHHVGITIGDVAGKGLDAAVLTSLVKNTIRAHASERGKTPADVMALTNDVLFKATRPESFVTVFFGILDCRDGRLIYANGGHTTAVLVTSRGDIYRLPVTGPILGAFESVSFEQAEIRIDQGEVLFLYTDGLTEARSDGRLYGENRLLELLSRTRGGTPHSVARAAIDEVVAYAGGHLGDDLAVLALSLVEYAPETPIQQKLDV